MIHLPHTHFIQQLTDMTKNGQELLTLLQEEESALKARDVKQINHLNQHKKEFINSFVSKQNELFAAFPASRTKTLASCVDEYINDAPTKEQEQLRTIWQQWLQQQRNCAKQNHKNGKVVISNLQNITRQLSIVSKKARQERTLVEVE